jgi:spore maturation protein CgeB
MGRRALRVGVIGPMFPDSFAENVAVGFEDLGHQAVVLGSGRPAFADFSALGGMVGDLALRSAALRARLQRGPLVSAAVAHDVDLVVNIDASVAPEVIADLKRRVPRVVFWFPDGVAHLGRQSMMQAPYDAVFSTEPHLVRVARDLAGLPFHYLAEACNPRWHRPFDVEHRPHIAVMGNYYPYRIRLLERLARAGIPLQLYGHPFPRWMPSTTLAPMHTGRYITKEEKARELRSAAAVLNAVHPGEIEGLNCRVFEASACGAAVLSEDRPLLRENFVPGQEVLPFADFDELVDQARWCLEHPDLARAIGDRASVRAHADHSYERRLTEMLRVVDDC